MNKEKMLELVEGQLQAYNLRDIEKFCLFFHPEVKTFKLSDQSLICEGINQFKIIYQKRFSENPSLHCELKSRIVLGESIIDEEWVTGLTGDLPPSHVVAIYSFRDNLIDRVWFTR